MTRNIIFWCVGFCFLVLAESAPRKSQSKNKNNREKDGPQLVYDQKQTGDYNIQLHLKDFQIIALLGDGGLGDYEYDYDYSDFTIKPSGPSSTTTTSKPSTTTTATKPPTTTTAKQSSTSTTTPRSSSTTIAYNMRPRPSEEPIIVSSSTNSPAKPPSSVVSNVHPYPLEIIVFEPTKKPVENKTPTSEKPVEESLIQGTSTEATPSTPSSTSSTPSSSTSLPSLRFSSPKPDAIALDKIKVQIVESPMPAIGANSIPLGIVPGEDVQADSGEALHGEIASYRKCLSGFSRDKKGRCRRLRKPASVASQLPFGFGRLASNLATRLMLPTQNAEAELPLRSL